MDVQCKSYITLHAMITVPTPPPQVIRWHPLDPQLTVPFLEVGETAQTRGDEPAWVRFSFWIAEYQLSQIRSLIVWDAPGKSRSS